MLNYIIDNLATIIVGALVFGVFAAVVVKLIRDKKNHKSSCGGGCCGCLSAQRCGAALPAERTAWERSEWE